MFYCLLSSGAPSFMQKQPVLHIHLFILALNLKLSNFCGNEQKSLW